MKNLKQTRHGLMCFDPFDAWIGQSFLMYGEYSPDETARLLSLLPDNAIVVDVGANIGGLTLPLARKAREVIAIEPQRLVFQTLCANLALNDIKNVIACGVACGAKNEELLLHHNGNNCGGASLVDSEKAGEPVAVIPLDALTLPSCHLIKIDVEGYEAEVLEGAKETIARHRPLLYVEADRHEKAPALVNQIKALGYIPFWDITPLYSPNNFDGNTHNAFPGTVNINLLCWPEGTAMPSALISELHEAQDGDDFLKLKARAEIKESAA